MSAYLVVFVAAGATAAATGLGTLPFLLRRRPGRTWLGTANALAVGFMVGASIGLVVEGPAPDLFGRRPASASAG